MTTRQYLVAVVVLLLAAPIAWAKGGGIGGGGVGGGGVGGGASPGGGGGRVGPAPGPRPGTGARGGSDIGNRGERARRVGPDSQPGASSAPGRPRPSRPTPARPSPLRPNGGSSLVHLHHGSVRLVADLARVDLTLEVQNTGTQQMEWARTYAIDPQAEITGAVLKRVNEPPITARTLNLASTHQIYAQIRTPPPRRTFPNQPGRDPLMLERPQRNQLRVTIWPIAANETIRVELTFVTPLRGRGAHRTYVDVMGGPKRATPPPKPEPVLSHKADWLMNPGTLMLSSAEPNGMTLRGEAGGLLHFTGPVATETHTPRPNVTFLTRKKPREALLVGGGSYVGRIATWRFDPRAFLTEKGYDLQENLKVRLVPKKGIAKRLAPNVFYATSNPLPVTALIVDRQKRDLQYKVEVIARDGHVIETYAERMPIRAKKLDSTLEATISGWHRASLVKRVYAWAGRDSARVQEAVRYAIDLGVLTSGNGALAIPANERQRLSQRNRRIYDSEGVPLGAPKREADYKTPPKGSLD